MQTAASKKWRSSDPMTLKMKRVADAEKVKKEKSESKEEDEASDEDDEDEEDEVKPEKKKCAAL